MDVDSIFDMFLRSIVKFRVKYLNYIGDGDSKTFTGILKMIPYGEDCPVTKNECVDTYKNVWVHGYGIKESKEDRRQETPDGSHH